MSLYEGNQPFTVVQIIVLDEPEKNILISSLATNPLLEDSAKWIKYWITEQQKIWLYCTSLSISQDLISRNILLLDYT